MFRGEMTAVLLSLVSTLIFDFIGYGYAWIREGITDFSEHRHFLNTRLIEYPLGQIDRLDLLLCFHLPPR